MVGTITSAGIGSGLDVNGLVSQLMAIERKPLDAMIAKQSGLNAKISAMGSLKSLVASLQTAASALGTASTFTALKGTVADTTIASATAGTTASSGTYALNVTKLAQSQILNTAQNPTVVAGTLSIAVAGGAAVPIIVGATDSLTTIAASINGNITLNPTASPTVKASVIDNRLVLESVKTGSANTVTVTGSVGLEAFNTANLLTARPSQDASFELNGITLTRSSNIVTDALTGVALNLAKADATGLTTTTLTVGNDSDAIVTAAQNFVTAFNAVNTSVRSLTAYNPTSKVAGALNGDSATASMQNQLRRALNDTPVSLVGGAYENLSKLGIGTATDGSLTVDAAKLQAAFDANPSGVAGAIAAFGTAMGKVATSQVSSTGLITGHIDSFSKTVSDIDKQSINMNYRLTKTEARLKAQFSSLDTLVSSMSSTSSFLSQQLANLAKSNA